jgi:hypothetical protein
MREDEMTPKMAIDFKCSSGWLQWFKLKWNITWQAVSGEGVQSDADLTEKWQERETNRYLVCLEELFQSGLNVTFL